MYYRISGKGMTSHVIGKTCWFNGRDLTSRKNRTKIIEKEETQEHKLTNMRKGIRTGICVIFH
jgi:hypothetical protein